ncbi:ABC transporter ATP-binding protein [Metallumcola ferriviriculae]|uniref:ABC transporter ATP-binding protein n=1 Tax=Metallumcola ferriviriculae TaxID=3039180 RepID=A0AAU0US84_9FIRM|nr:ABC transporter ATP-binding protein [Desulfitibacteraceae bacterium MK1]
MLKVENLTIAYGKTEVVHHVSFDVKKGSVVTIAGANGAGKSTILNTIVGLHRSKEGNIVYNGEDITRKAPDKLVRKGIRLVPEGRQIFAEHTVEENILLGAYVEKDAKKIRDRMDEMFDRFPRLKERRKQIGGTLSGGEQQMLAIVRALITGPDLLILDEPSLGLAPIIVKDVFKLLTEIKQMGVTIILVEQMVENALSISDYAYILETGNIVFSGTKDEVKNSDDIVKAYLGNV